MADEINTSVNTELLNINLTVFLSLVLLYIYSKGYSSSTKSLSFLKGKFNSFCGLLLKITITATFIYNLAFNFLSTKFEIDRVAVEIQEMFNHSYKIDFKDYSFDLASVMVYSLKISQLLFTSCIFLAISLAVPENTKSDNEQNINPHLITYNSSIATFCKLWAIFRIPILFYSRYLITLLTAKLGMFVILLFANFEFALASVFLLLIKFKNYSTEKKHHTEVGLFAMTLLVFGLFKYGLNLVDLPFELNSRNLSIVTSIQSGLMISIFLFLTEIIFPKKTYEIPNSTNIRSEETIKPLKFDNDVSLIESIIEFDERKGLISHV